MVDQTATSGSIGASQLDPIDTSSEYWIMRFIIMQMQAQLETMMPVKVVTFHAGTGTPPTAGTVDVQLLVSQIDGDGNAVPHGIVYGIPCDRNQGGKWAIILDPAEGDFGYIVSASRDMSNVVKNPGIQIPGSRRKYSFSDGVYRGGILNPVPEATIWLKPDGTFKISDANGIVLDTTSGSLVITGNVEVNGTLKVDDLETGEDGLNIVGAITATGNITAGHGGADSVGLQSHEHPTAATGSPSPPTPGT